MTHLSESDLDKLKTLEEELWKGETRFDEKYMRKVMSEDFFEFGRSGRRYTLEDTLSIDSQEIEARLPLPDLQIRQIAPEVAQVTYNSAVSYSGKVEHARRSSIWTKTEGGDWKLRFHQGTPYVPST